jgi:hypothetical protein
MKTTPLKSTNSVNRWHVRLPFVLIPFVLISFALSPQARATCQQGCLTNQNTVLGDDALLYNTAINNTAIGFQALFSNTAGYDNTANGALARHSNTTGTTNTAIGFNALYSNTTGSSNMAIGFDALQSNTTGEQTRLPVLACSRYCRNLTVTWLEQVEVPESHTSYTNLCRPMVPVESVYLPVLGTVAITVPLR